jgi:hypothetical protein
VTALILKEKRPKINCKARAKAMDIELYGSSQRLMDLPQQQWHGEDPAVSQTALFAGNDMHAQAERAGKFALLYLGYKTGGFTTIDAAKTAAPEFARRVLAHMSDAIST